MERQPTNQGGESAENHGDGDGQPEPTVESYIAKLEKYLNKKKKGSPRPPSKRYHKATSPTYGIRLLQALQSIRGTQRISITPPEMLRVNTRSSIPQVAESSKSGASAAPGLKKPAAVDLPFLAFYAEWKAYLGPDPDEPMPPPIAFEPDVEALRFFMLFPYGTGHYLGPQGHGDPMTFEEYAQYNLVTFDDRFRGSQEWLLWALTRTESRDLAATINCALVLFHGGKARHMGGGVPQVLLVSDDFEPCILVDGKLVPERGKKAV